jgi:hypothetical protein
MRVSNFKYNMAILHWESHWLSAKLHIDTSQHHTFIVLKLLPSSSWTYFHCYYSHAPENKRNWPFNHHLHSEMRNHLICNWNWKKSTKPKTESLKMKVGSVAMIYLCTLWCPVQVSQSHHCNTMCQINYNIFHTHTW